MAPHQDLLVRSDDLVQQLDGSVVDLRDVTEGNSVQRGDGPRPEERGGPSSRRCFAGCSPQGVGASKSGTTTARCWRSTARGNLTARRRRLRWGGVGGQCAFDAGVAGRVNRLWGVATTSLSLERGRVAIVAYSREIWGRGGGGAARANRLLGRSRRIWLLWRVEKSPR